MEILKFGPGKNFFPSFSDALKDFLSRYTRMKTEVLQISSDDFKIRKTEVFVKTIMPLPEYGESDGYPLVLNPPKHLKPNVPVGIFDSKYQDNVGKQEITLLCCYKYPPEINTYPFDDSIKRILENTTVIRGFIIPETLEFTMKKFGGEWLEVIFNIETDHGDILRLTIE